MFSFWNKMIVMLYLLNFFLSFTLVSSNCEPGQIYPRFSSNHTACLAPNQSCEIIKRGLSQDDIEVILDVHNKLRNKIASGDELGKYGFPPAINMMQLVWDKELQHVAQKHADQCVFEHDCNACRSVDNFKVGQNLYLRQTNRLNIPVNLTEALGLFYDEISFSPPALRTNFSGGEWGHFTQMVWAKTWRVGCGMTTYKLKSINFDQGDLLTCNYGPAGNFGGQEMYKSGIVNESSTLQCPENSMPSANYTSLCHVVDGLSSLKANVTSNTLFYCEFEDDKNCNIGIASTNSNRTFAKRTVIEGKYLSFELNETEQVSLELPGQFSSPVGLCINIDHRKGAAIAGEEPANELKVKVVIPDIGWQSTADFGADASRWFQSNMHMHWDYRTNITLLFSAIANSTRQYFDLKKVVIYAGECIV